MKWNNSVARRFFHCPQNFLSTCVVQMLNWTVYIQPVWVVRRVISSQERVRLSFGHTPVLIKTRTDYTFSAIVAIKLTGAFCDMQPEVSSLSSRISTQNDWSHSTFRHTIFIHIAVTYIDLLFTNIHLWNFQKNAFFFKCPCRPDVRLYWTEHASRMDRHFTNTEL